MSPALHDTDLALLAQRPSLPALATVALRLAVVLVTWDTRRKTRNALRKLDIYQLRDIGVNAIDARHEAARPFWKA